MDLEGHALPMGPSSSARVGTEVSSIPTAGFGDQLPPPHASENDLSPAVDSTPWPGSNFKVENVLPGSVYMWACGETLPRDSRSCVSRSQTAAAWVIIISQAICYAGLWFFSGNHPSDNSQSCCEKEADSDQPPGYSVVAIAGAMYLIFSIAAADVWCGSALVLEGRGSGFVLFTRRRVFGVFLLATFFTLIGASIRVLFYSAEENVYLVLGAAAVLFIADVDEKAMMVLQNIGGEWVLFWVLESMGLSIGLAFFAIKVTGNTEAVTADGQSGRCLHSWTGNCEIFDWYFILTAQPTFVTAGAFLLTSVISRTTTSLPSRVLFPRSWKWSLITLLVLSWGAAAPLWLTDYVESIWFDAISGGCALLFSLWFYRSHLTRVNCAQIFRKVKGQRLLLCLGGLLITLRFALTVAFANIPSEHINAVHAERTFYALYVADAAQYAIIYVWLMNGLRLANLGSAELDSSMALLPFVRPMLLGWGLSEGSFAFMHWVFENDWLTNVAGPYSYVGVTLVRDTLWLTWHLIIGVVLWSKPGGVPGVAYWTAASLIRTNLVECAHTWAYAIIGKQVQ